MKKLYSIIIVFLCILNTGFINAQELFTSDSILNVQLQFPMSEFLESRREAQEFRGKLVFQEKDSIHEINVKVSRRGNFRSNAEHCNFYPIRLKINAKQSKNTIFDGIKKLKLVTHCNSAIEDANDRVIKEFLLYKMYSSINPYSFKVRLLRIHYSDTQIQGSDKEFLAFAIMDDDDLAETFGGKILKVHNIHPGFTADSSMTLINIFQFMAGNTDWSVKTLHNIELMTKSGSAPIAIPYDFDFSGFVDSPDAIPAPHLPITKVRQRYYNGHCQQEYIIQWAINEFYKARPAIYKLMVDYPMQNIKTQKENIAYIDDFYKLLSDKEKAKEYFLNHCRKN
ncbi:MAG: hypothetical protein Q7J34_11100 [Bacteroidales bacterium]|nr:hypothetical protein [Bacteroidales bacterium]